MTAWIARRGASSAALSLAVLWLAPTWLMACETPSETELGRRLGAHLRSSLSRGFSGAVLVENRGQVLLCGGYGWTDDTRQYKMTPETLFFVASITKHFTAAAILDLRARGLLALDAIRTTTKTFGTTLGW